MHCVAVIEANRPGLDTVIIWDDNGRLIAFAYEEGIVRMTRPLAAMTLDDGVNEVRDNFQIIEGQLTRIRDWHDTVARTDPVAPIPQRWGG